MTRPPAMQAPGVPGGLAAGEDAAALLDALCTAGALDDLDVAFARLALRLAGESASPALALAAALTSRHVADGDVCCVLPAEAGRVLAAGTPAAPDAAAWMTTLRSSPVVAAADAPDAEARPLVLDGAGRLYLQRYWRYERRVAADLQARSADISADVDDARLAADLAAVFPAAAGDPAGPDWQRVAAATAVLRRLCVISGGPGTGKTFTVTAVLALLAAQALARGRVLRAALVAPTGKAAARMQEAVRDAREHLGRVLGADVVAALPASASTIHRLLGIRPDGAGARHGAGDALPLDALVVDEASMVDLALMAKLVEALPPPARLVLVGDRDQLASVEAGAVLGDVCGAAPGPSPALAARLSAIVGRGVPPGSSPAPSLADAVVVLRRSRRFASASGIGRLAAAVNAGDVAAAQAVLGGGGDVAWVPIETPATLRDRLERAALGGLAGYASAVRAWDPAGDQQAQARTILGAFACFRVVCAHRHGPAGLEEVGRHVEDALAAHGLVNRHAAWYPGRPVLVTRNDYALGVFNGDVGITLPDRDGRLRVVFLAADGPLRMLAPARLPAHETVWAMTVHKSQGSEFDQVVLVLPPEPSRITTRELLYTAITRARHRVEIWGPAAVVAAAIATPLERSSGLRESLWGRGTA